MLIAVDFRKRCVIDVPLNKLDTKSPNFAMDDIFGRFDAAIYNIEARYGDNLPKQGCVYKARVSQSGFDTYGYGNVHVSLHQYIPKPGECFNKPMPMPADLRAIDKMLKKASKPFIKLGVKSDPFMWMDLKYSITKSVLILANKHCQSLEIHTMSDLCAHDDYLELLSGHKIIMNMGFRGETETMSKLISPGAPSIKRRQSAIQKLVNAGIMVEIKYTDPEEFFACPIRSKKFMKRTGCSLECEAVAELRGVK